MKKKVLILCTGNSCRSQMAEGILRFMCGNKYDVYSAGVNPTEVNPKAIKVMSEINIDISGHASKHVDQFKNKKFDIFITVCDNAKETCPIVEGKVINWSFFDPAEKIGSDEEILNVFREVRDQIKSKIKDYFIGECNEKN